jgi:hypothetical protein
MILALVAGMGACGARGSSALPHCVAPPAGVGPGATATLQVNDAGSTVCLRPKATLTVYLQAPVGEASWSVPVASDRNVLATAPNGALTLPIGVTGAAFRARTRGVATISAVRSPCTIGSIETCDVTHSWHARVVVG